MRILLVELDRDLGGSVFSTIALAKELELLGNDVFMAIPRYGMWEKLVIDSEIPYIIIDGWPSVRRTEDSLTIRKRIITSVKKCINLTSEIILLRFILQYDIDIVHIATLNYECGYYACRVGKRKLVWHVREFLTAGLGITEWIYPEKSIKKVSNSDAIITISKTIHDCYSNVFPVSKVKFIYNGVDTHKFFYDRPHFGQNKAIRFVFLGRLIEGKGADELIKAFVNCDRNNIGLEIYGSGDENYKDYLRFLAESDNRISFEGFSSYPEKVMRNADVVCMCSKLEPFGRTTVEAMLSGCLVLGADSRTTKELIDQCGGVLYRQGDISDLTKRIDYICQNKETLIETVRLAQKKAKSIFAAERNAKDIYEVYKEILA